MTNQAVMKFRKNYMMAVRYFETAHNATSEEMVETFEAIGYDKPQACAIVADYFKDDTGPKWRLARHNMEDLWQEHLAGRIGH